MQKSIIFISLFLLGVGQIVLSCSKPQANAPSSTAETCTKGLEADPEALKVLFIGNSLTYFNDQPSMLRSLASEAGKNIFVDQHTGPGMQLEDHVASECTIKKISEQLWDVVVLQEAVLDVAFPELHESVLTNIGALLDHIKANHSDTKILYFLPWPHRDGLTYYIKYYSSETAQRMLRDGCLAIADTLDIAIAPVGWAWKKILI